MRRCEFITLLGGAAVASLFVARAQSMPVIGFLGVETPNVFAGRVRAFRQGLSETGYVEGRNVSIMFQWAGGHYDLPPTLADELVRQRACCRYRVFDKVNWSDTTAFHNTLVAGSSPTSSTTQSPTTGEILL